MTFDHPIWFVATFAAFAAWMVVFWRAHRWRRATVTFAAVWQRLAQRHQPLPLISRLRRALSVLLALVLASLLGTALAQPDTRTAPVVLPLRRVILLIDNAPNAVRERASESRSNLDALSAKAEAIVSVLSGDDETWLISSRRGVAVTIGPFTGTSALQEVAAVSSRMEADFTFCGWPELLSAANRLESEVEADLKAAMEATTPPRPRQTTLVLLTSHSKGLDAAGTLPQGTVVIDVGNEGKDAAFLSVTQTGEGSAHVIARGGSRLLASFSGSRDASHLVSPSSDGGVLVDLAFPSGETELDLTLVAADDPIPYNNRVVLRGQTMEEPTIGLSASDQLGYGRLESLVHGLMPGIGERVNLRRGGEIPDEFAILEGRDAVLKPGNRHVLCFGSLPSELEGLDAVVGSEKRFSSDRPGLVRASLVVPAELYGRAETFVFDGIQVFGLYPLVTDSPQWQVLLNDERLGPLAWFRRINDTNIVYFSMRTDIAYIASHPAFAVMLKRWLEHAMQPAVMSVVSDLLTAAGNPLPLRSRDLTEVEIISPFLRTPRRYVLQAYGSASAFAETSIPGSYQFSRRSTEDPSSSALVEVHEVHWLPDPASIPFEPTAPQNLDWLPARRKVVESKQPEPWVLRHWLLLAVLTLLLVEWGLFWIHLAE